MKDDRTLRVTEKKIPTEIVTKGMYIARLDRPWTDLPFLFQGFIVSEDSEIDVLQKYCEHVYVDIDLSPVKIDFSAPDYLSEFKLKGRKVEYTIRESFEDELPTAKMVFSQLTQAIRLVHKEFRDSETLNFPLVRSAVHRVIASVLNNPDPMLWLLHTRDPAKYAASRALGACVLTAVFGRFLGLPESMIQAAAIGGLLADLGASHIPTRILRKADKLGEGEMSLVREHVYLSLDALQQIDDISRHTLDAVAGHHERIDGKGYPQGRRGRDISPYARMLAITDSYDAITTARPYAEMMTPQSALQQLHNGAASAFEKGMVEQFVQCMSSFPTGAIVEFNSGEVGLVCSQHEKHRLRPRVRLIRDADKQPLGSPKLIDLAQTERDEQDRPIFIQRTHPIGSFGITRANYL